MYTCKDTGAIEGGLTNFSQVMGVDSDCFLQKWYLG